MLHADAAVQSVVDADKQPRHQPQPRDMEEEGQPLQNMHHTPLGRHTQRMKMRKGSMRRSKLNPRQSEGKGTRLTANSKHLHRHQILSKVMAAQTQLLQRLAEAAEHLNNGGNRQGPLEEDL